MLPPDYDLSHGVGLLLAIGAVSFVGCVLALRMRPHVASGSFWSTALRVVPASLFLATTAWLVFLLALKLRFPRIDPDIPLSAVLQSWTIVVAGMGAALGISVRARRSARNVALAGSIMSAAVSCMVFASVSGLAEPLALAYDLSLVVATMAVGSTLSAGGLWLLGRPRPNRIVAALLLAVSLTLLAIVSVSSVLPFSEWQLAAATPDAFAFRPVMVVFLSELGVTLVLGMAGAGVDRQASAQIARENARLRQFTESTFEALLIHRSGMVLDANTMFCELIGKPLAALMDQPVTNCLPECDSLSVVSSITGRPEVVEIEIADAHGATLPLEMLSRDIPYAGGTARVTALRDIRERRAAEARIRFLAQHDVLTGLPNRTRFQDAISHQLARLARDGTPLAVLCIDLDRFKNVNDTLGHWAGDLLLTQVADRLRDNIRENDTAARIGGDEFVLLQTGVSQPEASEQLARRLIEKLSAPFDLDGNGITIGTSIGIALAPHDSCEAAMLVRDADIALYRAKAAGRGTYCFFKPGMDTAVRERRELEHDIAGAFAEGSFQLAFQPQFSGECIGETIGFEALLRWPHPTRGLVQPDQFIPLAEETGLIVPIGTWVLETACREAASWPLPCRVAVNVSPRQFISGDLVAIVADVLRRTGLAADRLEIEITETLLIVDGDAAFNILMRLKQLGVRIVLDDFGTGYSSFSYLQRFPFDGVKIDKSFISTLTSSKSARAIVKAILSMSHELQFEVTAEGVESTEQLSLLQMQHCDRIQGFLLARPMPQRDVCDYLLRCLADQFTRVPAAAVGW